MEEEWQPRPCGFAPRANNRQVLEMCQLREENGVVSEGVPEVWGSGFSEGAAVRRTGVAANIPFTSFSSSLVLRYRAASIRSRSALPKLCHPFNQNDHRCLLRGHRQMFTQSLLPRTGLRFFARAGPFCGPA